MPKAKKEEVAAVDFTEGDSLTVDMSTVEEVSFEVMPRGLYNCIVCENEFTYSASAGNPMWSLQLEVEDGDYAGRRLFTHMVFAGKGMGITKRHLSRLAPELCDAPFDPTNEEIVQSILGRRICAKVTIRKWEGEDRNNVGDLLPAIEAGGFV